MPSVVAFAVRYLDDYEMPVIDDDTGSPVHSPDASIEGDDGDSIPDLVPGNQDLDESTAVLEGDDDDSIPDLVPGYRNLDEFTDRVAAERKQARHRAPNHQQEIAATELQFRATLRFAMNVLCGVVLAQLVDSLIIFLALVGVVLFDCYAVACEGLVLKQYIISKCKSGLRFALRYARFPILRQKPFGRRWVINEVRTLRTHSWAMDLAFEEFVERACSDAAGGMGMQDQAGRDEGLEEGVGSTSEVRIENVDEEDYVVV